MMKRLLMLGCLSAFASALCLGAPTSALAQKDKEGSADEGGWADDGAGAGEGEDPNGGWATEGEAPPSFAPQPAPQGGPPPMGPVGPGPGPGGEYAPQEQEEASAAPGSERSWYFGPFGRFVWVPSFMLEVFLASAPDVSNASFGIIADYRSKDGPTWEIGLGYTGYGFEGVVLADGDPETDAEWIDSDLAMIHATGSVLWKADLSSKLAFEYGVGLDLGVLIGSVVRTEAYRVPPGVGKFQKCPGPFGPPDPKALYCDFPTMLPTNTADQEGAHYGVEEDSIPPIGAGLMLPHLALRYDPIPELAIKLEAAYGIFQLWAGLSVAYAPEI